LKLGLIDLGLEWAGLKKIKKEKTWCHLVNRTRSGQKPDYNSLTFVFLLKRRSFNFLKKINLDDRSKP